VKPAQFVAVGIAQVSEVELAERILAIARRVAAFAVGAAGLKPTPMPGVDFLRAVEVEQLNPIVPPLACCAGCPSIGWETMNTDPLLR